MKHGYFRPDESQAYFCRLRNRHSFSLVEVVLALGVAVFAIVVIAALLPIGIQSTRDSIEETGALNVLSEVVADRHATPLANATATYQLPALTPTMTPVTNVFGVINDSQYSNNLNQATYRVTCSFSPPPSGTLDPYLGYFKVSWPAASTNAVGYVESVVTFPQP